MYRYETHLHTSPVSKCAKRSVRENVEFYKSLGYEGIFVTNHFLDGNISCSNELPYEEKIEFYFSDYENALEIGKEIGLSVFLGMELSYLGTDFLVYGIDKEWCLKHPEIMKMEKSDELNFLMENGALVIQAHPFREAKYIDHIRLFPRNIQGVEVINANRTDFENMLANQYADNYGLLKSAGSDNHAGNSQKKLAGIETEEKIKDERDFINKFLNGETKIFHFELQ